MLALLAALAAVTGCFTSDDEYQRLVEEKNALEAELAKANWENEILTRSLYNVQQEQESLQALLNVRTQPVATLPPGAQGASPGGSSAAAPNETAQQPQSGGGRTYNPMDRYSSTPVYGNADEPADQDEPADNNTATDRPKRTYKPRSGDTLYGIATKFNTSLKTLVDLNPYLANRRNYMIWDTDVIVLPN